MIKTVVSMIVGLFLLATSSLAATSVEGRWQSYYEETDAIIRNGEGVSIATQGNGANTGAFLKTGIWTWNFQDKTVSFSLKVSDWKNVSSLSFRIANELTFKSSAFIDIQKKVISPPNNEWISVNFPASVWSREGEVNFKDIDSILIAAADKNGVPVKIEVKDIILTDANSEKGIISISFDDGKASSIHAISLMDSVGMKGTLFIDPTVLGTPDFLSIGAIRIIGNEGWDISGHKMGPLPKLTVGALTQHLSSTRDFLKANGFSGANQYALPNGATNEAADKVLAKYFDAMFNINGASNNLKKLNTKSINRYSIDKTATLEQIQKIADNASNGEWVIINFHTFDYDLVQEEDWTLAKFASLIKYIRDKSYTVQPISKVLAQKR